MASLEHHGPDITLYVVASLLTECDKTDCGFPWVETIDSLQIKIEDSLTLKGLSILFDSRCIVNNQCQLLREIRSKLTGHFDRHLQKPET